MSAPTIDDIFPILYPEKLEQYDRELRGELDPYVPFSSPQAWAMYFAQQQQARLEASR